MYRLTARDLVPLAALGLLVRLVAAWPVDYAPYADAAYYTLVAERLASGDGFTVPVIWSFLEVGGRLPDPAILPVPSNGHWMPLSSVLAAGPMWLLGPAWRSGQLPSLLLSAALVPMTAAIAAWLFEGRRVAIVSGVLATFAGPLLLYYPTIDNFAVFGVVGAGAISAAIRAVQAPTPGRWLVISGLLGGLATLARVDGVLLLVAPATAWAARGEFRRLRGWLIGLGSVAAYLLVLSPWLLRNVAVFGFPLPSAGGSTLWITSYNEQFSIGHEVSLRTYLASGPGTIIGSKLASWGELVGRTAVLLGGTFLLTFVPGAWMARRRRDLWPFLVYFAALFIVMGGLFTFHAPRGAWYHSAPAWLPFALPMSVAAVPAAAAAGGRFWPFLRRPRTHAFLLVAALLGALTLSVAGSLSIWRGWDRSQRQYQAAAAWLVAHTDEEDVIMASDPSRIALLTGQQAVAASFDPYPVIKRIVDVYRVRWVVVQLAEGELRDPLGLWEGGAARDADGNHATWLADDPSLDLPGVRIYEVRP